MKPHRWAKEIIAWANGAEIEYRYFDNLESQYTEWIRDRFPNWTDDEFEFRIKPQPKEPQYLYIYERDGVVYVKIDAKGRGIDYIGKIKLETDDD